jgi:hypothetical protein
MKGLFAKTFMTVVLDGRDAETVKTIRYAIDIVTKERYGECVCRDFGSANSNAKVIETRTDKRTYKLIQGMIRSSYPGLCVFDVTM